MSYDASFERLPITACFDLKGTESVLVEWIGADVLPDFPAEANRCRKADGVSLDRVGPRHWLLRTRILTERMSCMPRCVRTRPRLA